MQLIAQRTRFALLAVTLTLAGRVVAADDAPVTDKLGTKIDFRLTDLDGKAVTPAPKATVVVFLSFECPVSNSYASPLSELAKAYAERGVGFAAVCPTEEAAAAVRKQAADYKLAFPVCLDPKLDAADAFRATATPEAFVIDGKGVLRYRGRIDDAWSARLKKNQAVTRHDLKDALDDVLAGKDVRTAATRPVGCALPDRNASARAVTTQVTFHKDVLPILQNRCQSCHRPGDVGPFSLMTYKQAVNWADDIKEYTASRKMPPWKPVEGPAFHADRRLTAAEIGTLAAWADGGTPEGDPKDAPAAKAFPEGWQLGKPDLVLQADEDFHLGPTGPDTFRCFVFPTDLPEDRYIVGYEVRPGNPRVVHHTLNYWDLTGNARKLEQQARQKAKETDPDHGPGYSAAMGIGFLPLTRPREDVPPIGGFGGWAPGAMYRFLPDGAGYLLPKGADIVIQTHYHRNGRPEQDRLQVGIYFAKKPVKKPWRTIIVDGFRPFSMIPANKADYAAHGSMWVTSDCTIHSVMPHMHLLGKSVKVTMTPPDGETRTLVRIDDWDYNWQETYWFKEPIAVKAGTRFDVESVFDNSDKNPHNPSSPPKAVWRGEETTNEMLFAFIGATGNGPNGQVRMSRTPPPAKAGTTGGADGRK